MASRAFRAWPTAAFILDDEGFLVEANEAAEALLGSALGVLSRRPLSANFSGESALVRLVARAAAEGSVIRESALEIAWPDRGAVRFEATATPMDAGAMLLTLSPAASASPRLAGDALQSVAGLGRTLAHEIKNPLAGIRGAAQLLSQGATPDNAALAQLIVDETDRIRRLVDRVEAFSDSRPLAERPVNLHRVLDRVRALMVAGAGGAVQIDESYDPSLPHAQGDEDQLIQVFLNLVKNAVEAAASRGDDRGEVTVATAFRHTARATPLEVRVQDNGPGVADSVRARLFHPFVTTKAQGAGLGLTLVAKLVAAHGGVLDFESEAGRTVFRVLLPYRAAASRPHS